SSEEGPSARCQEGRYLTLRQLAPLAQWQRAEREWTHAHATQARHPQADGGAHPADLPLPSGAQHQLKPAGCDETQALQLREAFFERDPAAQRRQLLRRRLGLDVDLVLALVTVPRMQDPLGPPTV